jgi:sporulation protein YtfJ
MKTAMESIKGMIDVNTVVGDAVETADGSVIVPVSRVTFGFAAGGGEYGASADGGDGGGGGAFPFGGGSGAGVSVQPMGFLVVNQNSIKMLPVEGGQPIERLIDMAPQLIEKIKGATRGRMAATGPDTGVPGTTTGTTGTGNGTTGTGTTGTTGATGTGTGMSGTMTE